MIAILVGAFVLALLFMKYCPPLEGSNSRQLVDYVGMTFFAIMGGFLGYMISLVIFISGGGDYSLEKQLELVAVQDNQNIHRQFFLGTEHTGLESVYYFYYKQNGGLVLGKCPANRAIVYEQEGKKDGLVKVYKLNEWQALGLKKYEIFIPKGSILQQFRLDAKQ